MLQYLYLSDKSELGLELLGKVHGVVDQGESSALATSEDGLESISEDSIGSALIHSSKFLTNCDLGDGSLARMKDINNHLGEININFIVACVCSSAFQQLK